VRLHPDHVDEAFRGSRALRLAGQQGELKRQGVACLRVAGEPAVRRDVLVVERKADAVGQRRVPGRVGLLAEEPGDVRQDLRGAHPVGGGHQDRIGPGRRGVVRRRGGIEPVAELERRLVEEGSLAEPGGEPVYPGAHAPVLAAQYPGVAEALVHDPRHEHRGVAPAGLRHRLGERPAQVDPRHEQRDNAVGGLVRGQVLQPRGEKAGAVVEVAGRRREYLEVAGPAEPLVPLRAVGRHVKEVPAHPPHHVLVQLRQQRV
jgi:hypothetical protein